MRLVFFFVSLFWLVGCSSVPTQSQAIHTALVTDNVLREAVASCKLHGGETRRMAERGQLDWWRRNGHFVLAADYGVLQLNWHAYREQSEAQRALNGMALLENIQLDAQTQLNDWLGQSASAGKCDKLFSRVQKGSLDLTKKSSIERELSKLHQQRQDLTADAASLRSINNRYRKYGRSLFNAEEALREAGCSEPNLALLRNSWPLEVYDSICSADDYVLVTCHWGRCEIKR